MFQDYNKPRTRSLQESHHHLINRTHIPGGPSVSSGQPKSKCSKGAPSHPLCPLCMLHLLHLVVRRSSSNTGVVDLPGPCLLSYSCLANTNYKIYSTPAHGQPVSESPHVWQPYPSLAVFPDCLCCFACFFCTCVF